MKYTHGRQKRDFLILGFPELNNWLGVFKFGTIRKKQCKLPTFLIMNALFEFLHGC